MNGVLEPIPGPRKSREHDDHERIENGNGNGKDPDRGEDGNEEQTGNGDIDPEEKLEKRDSERNRQFTDEVGHWPDSLAGIKEEEPPGPRNQIELKPRIPHIHYHQQYIDKGRGPEKGPILKITPDGEDEFPPGHSPRPSRPPSSLQERASMLEQAYEQGMGQTHTEGRWGSANETKPQYNPRWSSFRRGHQLQGDSPDESAETPKSHRAATRRWSMLRDRIVPSRNPTGSGPTPGGGKVSAMAPTAIASLPITTELLAGQLPVMILKTWLDRDDEGKRAVPVLLGNLRFRVGDSVGIRAESETTGKEMFKLECEYGDGAVKWVIYRELRDFLSLHAHYKAANFGTSVAGLRSSRKVEIPEFPRMSIPYVKKFANQSGKEKPIGKAEYAQAGRDALQQYLVELIRAVIFRPESNRLCKFFELSSLTLSLAPRGGFQGKAGFLKIPGANASRRSNQPGLTPTSWMHSREPKWCIVRDSYFVATDGPEATEFYDVFLLDTDFSIERPRRVYRHGMHLLSGRTSLRSIRVKGSAETDDDLEDEVDIDNPMTQEMMIGAGEGKGDNAQAMNDDGETHASHHTFFIHNSQRRLKLVAKNARQMHQFIVSMERIAAQSLWTGRNRFDSFAPLRVNVAAQWLVDGRDYFWNLSRAINMAKERIYIHDWWISPELYLRRPGDERYRLDNLLKRKAEHGVKIFIIIYNEVSDKTTPVDSLYTKRTLTNLHPNIMLQRSPSHFQTGTFYWSHHEKLCVIDETIAFMGGLDLCYGRWDTPQHVLTDEDHTAPDGPDGPVWRGKDYANERVMEYSALDKPFDDMFNRSKVPRMPWHDVGLQIVGQPARDLCRHFVARWNLLIRTKNHKRQMPFLLPPPDFTDRELHDLKLQGTCEVQICRSVGPWSMGTLTKIEHSIQNAYCKSIELSEHFVYIENQFFITSTVVDGIPIENGIGNALVNRIIKAHNEGTKWMACIVIPLLPGYTYPIDSNEASSVRLILECQNRTISRGTNSIFSRLRKEGIDPDDYITFFSLRGWSKFKSGVLTSEQVYIHGKTMVVDDRLVICGSANINERSQRGDRDSELVAVIRDTDMIDGTMAGKPFKVGRFAHTLRMRLMREHVGVDVDAIEEDQLMSRGPVAEADEVETWDPDHEQTGEDDAVRGITKIKKRTVGMRLMQTFESGMSAVTKGLSENALDNVHKAGNIVIKPIDLITNADMAFNPKSGDDGDVAERQDYHDGETSSGFASSVVPTLEEKTIFERRPSTTHANGKPLFDLIEEGATGPDGEPQEAEVPDQEKQHGDTVDHAEGKTRGVPEIKSKPGEADVYGAPANAVDDDQAVPTKGTKRSGDDASTKEREAVEARKTLRKHLNAKVGASPWNMPTPTPKINPNRFHDPLDERFWKDMWVAVAVHNTEIFRKVFRCIPDDLVTSWAQYKAFVNHAEKHNKTPEDVAHPGHGEPVKVTHDGPGTHGAGGGGSGGGAVGQGHEGTNGHGKPSETRSSDVVDGNSSHSGGSGEHSKKSPALDSSSTARTDGGPKKHSGPQDPWADWEKDEMEELLAEIRGHLVIYPTRFLEAEDLAGNFLFNSDKILPLPIYD
ncbi:putative phospholipase D [Naematelia encephala]|uniref:Phospholipase n=1 Tax=Naematelia encephala TaxID=71784 RepID=A0A1Y2B029_9TREE|nr:putative phospholipase D [Naematelia encephala]